MHISVTFSADIREAERMYKQWKYVAPCSVGGPAMGDRGGEFEPGRYLKQGITITSRGALIGVGFVLLGNGKGTRLESYQ